MLIPSSTTSPPEPLLSTVMSGLVSGSSASPFIVKPTLPKLLACCWESAAARACKGFLLGDDHGIFQFDDVEASFESFEAESPGLSAGSPLLATALCEVEPEGPAPDSKMEERNDDLLFRRCGVLVMALAEGVRPPCEPRRAPGVGVDGRLSLA